MKFLAIMGDFLLKSKKSDETRAKSMLESCYYSFQLEAPPGKMELFIKIVPKNFAKCDAVVCYNSFS